MHLVNRHQLKRNTSNGSCPRVEHFSYSAIKSVKHGLFFISKGISEQISIALYLRIFVPEFEPVAKQYLISISGVAKIFDWKRAEGVV